MARSNFSGAWGHNLQLEVFSAWNAPNIEGNFSTVNVQVLLIANGYAALWGATDKLLSLDIGGIREDARVDMSISQGQTKALWAKDYRVNHNPDGTKSITISATLHADVSNYGSATASFSLPLPNIPRASIGSSANGIFGQPITLNISRHSDAFKHAIWVKFGGYDKKITGDNVDTSFTWIPEMSMINEIPNASSGYGTLTYITYNNGREIGRNTQPVTLSVPDNIKPTLTGFTLTDTNTAAASVVPGEQAFIQILSNIKVNFGQATGAYGSTITGYYAEIVGKNQSTTTQGGSLGIMNYIGNVTIRARVTDSRGRTSNAIERTVNILEYFAPILSISAARSGAQSSTLTITRNAKVASLTVDGLQKNQMKLIFKVAKFGSDDYKVDTGSASGTWTTVSSLINSNANLQGEYTANSSWTVLGILEDKFTRTEFAVNVATESVVMSYGKDRIGFGKIAEFTNVTDSAWEYYFSGKPIQNRQLTNSDGRNLANVYKTPDDYVTTGFYYSDSSLLPDRSGGYLLVESYNTDFVKQTYTPWDKAYTFIRLKIGKNKPWTAWVSPALEQCYPIGSIYQSTEPTNPATFMGGVWERFGNGRVLVGVDETDADFNAANKTGGNSTVSGIGISPKGYGLVDSKSFEGRALIGQFNASSDEMPLNSSNLQPYITIYRWRRTA
jgi:hypothetical protein